MGQPKTLTKNELMRVVGVSGRQNKKITWHTTEIIVKQFLPLDEYVDVVHQILSDCQINGDGQVAVELVDFAIRMNIISSYAFVNLPEDIESLYAIVYTSDLYDTICANVNNKQIEDIKRSVYAYLS